MKKIKVHRPDQSYIKERNINQWPIWQKEVSRFPWTYDCDEECYILEGEVVVETEVETVHIKSGDFVVFPEGLTCVWDIKKPIKKHYNFP